MKKKKPIRSAEWTYYKLGQQDEFQKFFRGLIEFLQKKLNKVKIEGEHYYTCGQPHTRYSQDWQSFPNLWNYTDKKGFDFYAVKDLIDEFFFKELLCECEILCSDNEIRRRELEKSMVYFWENPGSSCPLSQLKL